MKKMTRRKSFFVLVSAFLFMGMSCWSQQLVTVHKSLRIADFPVVVTPAANANEFKLTSLAIKKSDGNLVCSLNYRDEGKEGPEYLLMFYLSFDKKLILAYYTDEIRQAYIDPPGKNGEVAFTMEGYSKKKGPGKQGAVTFKLPLSMYGLWDIHEGKGTAYVFLMSKDKDLQIKDDTFLSVSNILPKNF